MTSANSSQLFAVSNAEDTYSTDGFVGTNVCRVAVISSLLEPYSNSGISTMSDELVELGFSEIATTIGSGSPRALFWSTRVDRLNERRSDQVSSWIAMNESGSTQLAIEYLVLAMGSRAAREAAAAAVALWLYIRSSTPDIIERQRFHIWQRVYKYVAPDWLSGEPIRSGIKDAGSDPDSSSSWHDNYESLLNRRVGQIDLENILRLASSKIAEGLISRDEYVLTLSATIFPFRPATIDDELSNSSRYANASKEIELTDVSTIIHGTNAYKGDWWYPGGDFHSYILDKHRANLYNKAGTAYDWSGALSATHRQTAASRLNCWIAEQKGTESIFAHSYGGDVAAMAIEQGANVDQLILLSCPISDAVERVANAHGKVLDIRVRIDPVLTLLRMVKWNSGGSRLKSAVKIDLGWGWHGASHDPYVWESRNLGSYL